MVLCKVPKDTDNSSADYKLAVVDLFKEGKIPRSKKTAMYQVRPEEMEELFLDV